MNRQTRTLIVLAVAIVGATVASYGVYTALARLPQRGSAILDQEGCCGGRANACRDVVDGGIGQAD